MKTLIVIFTVMALVGCTSLTLPDGTVIKGKSSVNLWMLTKAQSEIAQTPAPAITAVEEMIKGLDPTKLSASGQVAFFDLVNELQRGEATWKLVASARDRGVTMQSQIAASNTDAFIASEQASAQKTASYARLGGFLVGGLAVAAVADTVARNAGARYSYGDTRISQSNSINESGYDTNPNSGTGSPGEGLSGATPNAQGFVSDGTRSNVVNMGGSTNFGVQDQSPSAVLQPGNSEKPVAVDNNADFSLDDRDGNGDNSLIPGF